ncbi:MAG: threonine-phosphate decarboxylase [Alphaproteobacteria bacterium]|nr:threonine-phosphate decarboxylase [Alphaproteobacteria bacterium]
MNSAHDVPAYHGGDLQNAEALFGRPSAGWLDLSTGVNPESYPNTAVDDTSWQRLPQQQSMEALMAAARRYYRVPDTTEITVAPGSQSVLQHLPTLFEACRVAVIGPCYAEHEKTWSACGHVVETVEKIADTDGADIVVVVNPNNPDGRTFSASTLLDLARRQTQRNGLLVIDEAFADVDPDVSLIPELSDESALVIRSFGKFFGLPGLRLGFAVSKNRIVSQLERRLGPWPVSGAALEIGARALSDNTWIDAVRARLATRCNALDQVLRAADLNIIGGTALFRLIESDNAPRVFEQLGRAGIFVRMFPERPSWLRIAVPGSDNDLRRLENALR